MDSEMPLPTVSDGTATKKMWQVHVELSATVFVVAKSRSDAENIASRAVDRGDIDLDEDASASVIEQAPAWAVDEDPLGLASDDVRTVGEWLSGKPDPETWKATRPTTLAALPSWLALSPLRPSWVGAVDGGAAACDGHGMLMVGGAEAPELVRDHTGPWRDTYRRLLTTVSARTAHGAVTIEAIDSWLAASLEYEDQRGCVMGVSVSAPLVERWVVPAARIAGVLEVSVGLPLEAVMFRGPGWCAFVMPMRADDSKAPSLAVTVGG